MRDTGFNLSNASFWVPDLLSDSAWLAHAPFAFWLIDALRPRCVVELGTHSGFSFFSFCQAIARLDLGTRAFAVDTWKGDEHAGFYGEDVFEKVQERNRAYRGFATLMRSTFDAALSRFEDGSIDLLHIDGLHHYEDVEHDFASWRPKLKPDAVVLFHDTQVREREFGVWRLWRDLSARFPAFEFLHGHGLGVLCPGAIPDGLKSLMSADDEARAATRAAYGALGSAVVERQRASALDAGLDALLARSQTDGGTGEGLSAVDRSDHRLIRLEEIVAARGTARDQERLDGTSRREELPRELARPDELRRGADKALQDLEIAERRRDEAERAKAEAERRRDLAEARDAGHDAALRAARAEIELLRRSLVARMARTERTRREGDRSDSRDSLLERALLGRDDRRQREQQAVADRYDELLHWGRSRRERQDRLVARLDAALAALAEAESRLSFFEHSRLVRAAAKAARVRRRGSSPGDARSARDEPERRASTVRDTGLFDDAFYRSANADVASGTGDPASHFAETGWWEGRWPNARFDPAFYLATNPDVAEAGDNPLVHYAEQGILEGRRPSAPERVARWVRPSHEALHPADEVAVEAVLDTGLFDERFYREAHPDVVLSGLEPVLHFALDGWKEGRRPNPHFDPAFYLEANRDVAASGENPLVHYATVGIFEGRAPSREAASSHASSVTPEQAMAEAVLDTGLFDAEFYRTAYPDVPSSSSDAAVHFATHGWKEGASRTRSLTPPSISRATRMSRRSGSIRCCISPSTASWRAAPFRRSRRAPACPTGRQTPTAGGWSSMTRWTRGTGAPSGRGCCGCGGAHSSPW